ncbi:MAG: hypothetical protein U0796_17295 [Gemmatales bacterium]
MLADAANQTTSYQYDMLNRVTRETDPRGKERTFGYDANSNRTEVVDHNGRQRTFKCDTLDRMTGETWWNGSTAGTQFTYTYNAVGQVPGRIMRLLCHGGEVLLSSVLALRLTP